MHSSVRLQKPANFSLLTNKVSFKENLIDLTLNLNL